jgi:hypothetical protein
MTKEEIMGMKQGQELDKLVAEKVMGLDVRIMTTTAKYAHGADSVHNEYYIYKEGWFGGASLKRYSSDISAAFEVVEKWGYQAQVGYQGGDYFCHIMRGFDENGEAIYGEVGDCGSASEAICKAALLAVTQ